MILKNYFRLKKTINIQNEKNRFFSLPNFLTLFRVFLIIPIALNLNHRRWDILILLILVNVILDMIDGHWARSTKQISKIGRYLDSFSDKLMCLVILSVILIKEFIPLKIIGVVLASNLIQIFCTFLAIFIFHYKTLPKTYLQPIVFFSISIGLFTHSPIQQLWYGLGLVASINHLIFYIIFLIPDTRRKKFKVYLNSKLYKLNYLKNKIESRNYNLKDWTKNIFSWANVITLGRAFLILIIAKEVNHSFRWLFWVLLFWIFDIFDGLIARFFNQTSKIGKILDAFVDKMLFVVLIWRWWQFNLIEDWLIIIFAVRIFVVGLTALIVFVNGSLNFPIAYWSIPSNISLILSVFFPFLSLKFFAAGFALQLTIHYPYQAFIDYLNQSKQ